jgi:hypothetical protein
MDGRTERWTDRRLDGRTDSRTDSQMDGLMDWWMDRHKLLYLSSLDLSNARCIFKVCFGNMFIINKIILPNWPSLRWNGPSLRWNGPKRTSLYAKKIYVRCFIYKNKAIWQLRSTTEKLKKFRAHCGLVT